MSFASPYAIAFFCAPAVGLLIAGLANRWCVEDETPAVVASRAGGRLRLASMALCLAVVACAFAVGPADAPLRVAAGLALGWTLVALSLVDARSMLLPDALTLPLIMTGLLFWAVMEPDFLPAAALGAGCGYLSLWGLARLYERLRGTPGMGLGDAKLLAAGGAFLGWQALPAVLAIAGWLGLFWFLIQRWRGCGPRSEDRIPFGPFLALSIWACWLAMG